MKRLSFKPFKWTLQNKALAAFIVGSCLSLGLILVTWQSLKQTQRAVDDFEALLIPEIRNALILSDEAAQIVAMAPYLASAGRPMQLQTERQRLHKRYQLAYSLSEELHNRPVREQLQASLENIQSDLDRLTTLVYDELFIHEDLFSAQFEVDRAQASAVDSSAVAVDPWRPLQRYYLSITEPEQYIAQSNEALQALAQSLGEQQDDYLEWLRFASDQQGALQRLERNKAFLLARLRAHSEQLTQQTNSFATDIQHIVLNQQRAVSSRVRQALLMTVGLTLVLLAAIGFYYLNNRRLIRDLAVVTEDMGHLSRGEEAPVYIDIERDDEIGDLVTAYDVFRDHALAAERTSTELDAQKTVLETVFNQIQDGLSLFSGDDRLIAWNQRYLEIFQFDSHSLFLGMPLLEVQALMARKPHRNLNLNQEAVDMSSLNACRHHTNQNFERHYDDGQIVEFRSQPMPSGGFVTLYSDQTVRRSAEQQLQQSQKMEVLGQLTGGVAHDFNNLLAALMGNLQLLERLSELPDRSQTYLHRALDVSERGAQLVRRLLAFSRKQQLQPEMVIVDELIDGMEELLQYSVAAPVRLQLQLEAPGTSLYIDPSQLENAILNLTLNSAAAIPAQGWIRIRTGLDEARHEIVIEVSDNGTGIPIAMQKRVLEPFFTTKPAGQGSGLGLSTVYGFVKQSGGDLQLQSVPQQGTRIQLAWPLTDEAVQRSVPEPLKPVEFERAAGVALVEDEPSVRLALTELLQARGLAVTSFEHGEQFIDWIQHQEVGPGLLISDVNLGGQLNGIDVVSMANKYWPDTPCLLISGLPQEMLEQTLGLTIHWRLLAKPLSRSDVEQLFPA